MNRIADTLTGILHISEQEIGEGKSNIALNLGIGWSASGVAKIEGPDSVVFAAVHAPGLEVAAKLEAVTALQIRNRVTDQPVVLHISIGEGLADIFLANAADCAEEIDDRKVPAVGPR